MAELTFATLTILKEVYLLSRFIARTARSASNSNTEREALQKELEYEHLYIRSFGLLFFQSSGVLVPHQDLNREWLEKITWILDGLRLAEGDYAKLAAERDVGYRRLSPFLNTPTEQRLIEFEAFDNKVREVAGEDQDDAHQPDSSSSGIKNILPSMDWRWALSEKKHLQRILSNSREWTKKLKEMVQLTMAVNLPHSLSTNPALQPLGRDRNARFLGLSGHARIRQTIEAPAIDVANLEIKDGTLELPTQRTTLTPATLRTNADVVSVLVETKPLPEVISAEDEQKILHLAQILALSAGTDLSTLPLHGFLRLVDQNAYAFVFDFPLEATDAPPVTLFDLIRRPHSITPGLSLKNRFKIAQSIAKSLVALHADNWVHKSFRSRSIVFFHSQEGAMQDRPYLVNFEYSRSTHSATNWTYDDDAELNLYRHPLRQRPPQKSFNQIHDLYALGVVLLEIGLWRAISSVKEQAQAFLEPGTNLDPEILTEFYISTASRDLPHTMGDSFAKAVVTCLKGDFGVSCDEPAFSLAVFDGVIQKLDAKLLLE